MAERPISTRTAFVSVDKWPPGITCPRDWYLLQAETMPAAPIAASFDPMVDQRAGLVARWLSFRLRSLSMSRAIDETIGGEGNPYIRRWYIVRRRWLGNIYLHQILRSDDDRALHDHPWWNVSIVLHGGYWEIVPTRGGTTRRVWRGPGSIVFRSARQAHRLELETGPYGSRMRCWSLFITGPKIRPWGFWCPQGWTHNAEFDRTDGCGSL